MSLDVAAVAADSASLYAIKTPTRWITWLQATVNNTGNDKPTQVSPNRHNNVWINLTDYSGDKDRNLRPCCSGWLGNQNTSLLDSLQSCKLICERSAVILNTVRERPWTSARENLNNFMICFFINYYYSNYYKTKKISQWNFRGRSQTVFSMTHMWVSTSLNVSPNRHNSGWIKRLFRQRERYYDRDFALVALYCNCLLSIHRLGG